MSETLLTMNTINHHLESQDEIDTALADIRVRRGRSSLPGLRYERLPPKPSGIIVYAAHRIGELGGPGGYATTIITSAQPVRTSGYLRRADRFDLDHQALTEVLAAAASWPGSLELRLPLSSLGSALLDRRPWQWRSVGCLIGDSFPVPRAEKWVGLLDQIEARSEDVKIVHVGENSEFDECMRRASHSMNTRGVYWNRRRRQKIGERPFHGRRLPGGIAAM